MNDARAILQCAKAWLDHGHKVAFATVVKTWGSAPRGIGCHLIVRDDGLFEGSVSGGCVEGAVIEAAQMALQDGKHHLLSFGVSDAAAWEVGLACGGTIDILVQPNFSEALINQILESIAAGKSCTVITDTLTGVSQFDDAKATVAQRHETQFINVYEPDLRLAVIGAVHIAQALLPMAAQLGYAVQLIDPRTAFTNNAHFASAATSNAWPDEALQAWAINERSAVVTLTHDPKLDDPALEAALASPAFYIAALGSKKTHDARRERLRVRGFSEQDVARIHGPAGLRIGAKTPAEIALSVLAEMTSVLRQRVI
jgi:xanthine dehydrogenase accessory factor